MAMFSRSAEGLGVGLCWAHAQPRGPQGWRLRFVVEGVPPPCRRSRRRLFLAFLQPALGCWIGYRSKDTMPKSIFDLDRA
jgi:hypothetical protein